VTRVKKATLGIARVSGVEGLLAIMLNKDFNTMGRNRQMSVISTVAKSFKPCTNSINGDPNQRREERRYLESRFTGGISVGISNKGKQSCVEGINGRF